VNQIGAEKTVWVRGSVSATQCPKSILTPDSLRLLELFAAWKLTPAADLRDWPARDVDGLFVLEQEWRSLQNHGDTE
jgi:hypothetical protein